MRNPEMGGGQQKNLLERNGSCPHFFIFSKSKELPISYDSNPPQHTLQP